MIHPFTIIPYVGIVTPEVRSRKTTPCPPSCSRGYDLLSKVGNPPQRDRPFICSVTEDTDAIRNQSSSIARGPAWNFDTAFEKPSATLMTLRDSSIFSQYWTMSSILFTPHDGDSSIFSQYWTMSSMSCIIIYKVMY